MSVIKTDLLQNRLGTSHPAVTKADFIKAWVHFNGITMSVDRSFNVASITDSAVGSWSPFFTALMDGPHTPAGYAHYAGVSWVITAYIGSSGTNLSIQAYQIASAPAYDCNLVGAHTVGTLA